MSDDFKFIEVGMNKPLGRRGGEGQYTLINVSTIWNGGTGMTERNNARVIRNEGSQGTDQIVSFVQGANRGVFDRGASSKIVTGVALPMPNGLSVQYGADWSIDDTGIAERGVSGTLQAITGNQSLNDLSSGFLATLKGQVANELTGFLNSSVFRKSAKDYGYGYNPHKEQFYNGPQFRSLQLEWNLSFENKKEADEFDRLVERLAEHMHPDFVEGATSGVWKIPDTFFVEFVNAKTRKYGAMILKDLAVNYTNSGAGWKAFKDGNPAHVSLMLLLQEIAPLSKEDIRAGR